MFFIWGLLRPRALAQAARRSYFEYSWSEGGAALGALPSAVNSGAHREEVFVSVGAGVPLESAEV